MRCVVIVLTTLLTNVGGCIMGAASFYYNNTRSNSFPIHQLSQNRDS